TGAIPVLASPRCPYTTLFRSEDTLRPDRLVYGVEPGSRGERAARLLDEVYRSILDADTPRLITSRETAELVKVSANAFLATKIRSEEHTSELQSRENLVCRLL